MSHPSRPFRHLCPEADKRDAMTDGEFWQHVADQMLGNDLAPDYEPDPDEYRSTTDLRGNGIAVISDHVSPCPICHSWAACGYDEEGRPMIHALYDEEE